MDRYLIQKTIVKLGKEKFNSQKNKTLQFGKI